MINTPQIYKAKGAGLFLLGLLFSSHIMTCSSPFNKSGKASKSGSHAAVKTETDSTVVIHKSNTDSLVINKPVANNTKAPAKDTVVAVTPLQSAVVDTTPVKFNAPPKAARHLKINDDGQDVLNQKFRVEKEQDVTSTPIIDTTHKPHISVIDAAFPSAPDQGNMTNTIEGTKIQDTTTNNINTAITPKSGKAQSVQQNALTVQTFSKFTTVVLRDSTIAKDPRDYQYNNITITNTSSDKLNLIISITMPGGWQLVTDKVYNISLDPNTNQVISMRYGPSSNASASWDQIRIEYLNVATGERVNNFVATKMQEFTKFKAKIPNPSIVLPGYQNLVSFPVYIKNLGNTSAEYEIKYVNEFFHLEGNAKLTLAGGVDTSYNITLAMSENEFKMLKKEEIKITVANKGDLFNLTQVISKIGYILKDHSSAYIDMPLQLEAGMTSQGKNLQYYGALYGNVDLDDHEKVAVALRSNTFTTGQSIDNSMMRMDYSGKHLSASVGNIMEMTDFMMDGYGAKTAYNWGTDNRAVIYGELKSRVGNSQVYGGALQYRLNDMIRLTESVSDQQDNIIKQNSSIARQTVDLKINDKTRLSLVAGVGLTTTGVQMINNEGTSLIGSSFGYTFQYNGKRFNILSNVLENSNSFTGVYKGQKIQTHDVRLLEKNFFIGGFYEHNEKSQTYFLDSIQVKNEFGLQNDNYGTRVGYTGKGVNAVLSLGEQKQIQGGETNGFQTVYNYLNLNSSVVLGKHMNLNLNSYGGYGSVSAQGVNNILITSTQAAITIYNSGIAARYDKGPFYYSDFANYLKTPQSMERVLLSPYVDLAAFKNNLTFRAQYNYTKGTGQEAVANVMVNVGYANPIKGYDFHVTGTLPTSSTNNIATTTYISAAFRMRLNAPFVAIRKYYNFKIVLFEDANSNGEMDGDEKPVPGQMANINGNLFISDMYGIIMYENVAKGNFRTDLGLSCKVKGWAPRDGAIQNFEVKGNTTVYVPYRKSKVLAGKLNVVVDSFSNIKFDPNHIKVTAVSEDNISYSTLTDEKGEFYFNVPTGHYTVSLSQLAFDDHFKPSSWAIPADMTNNEEKTVYFEIRQKRRKVNVH